jgi:hypothetical protein
MTKQLRLVLALSLLTCGTGCPSDDVPPVDASVDDAPVNDAPVNDARVDTGAAIDAGEDVDADAANDASAEDGGDAAPPAVPIPADLVGHWKRTTSVSLASYTFTADGHYYLLDATFPGSCIVISKVEETEEGSLQASGGKLFFSPTSCVNVEFDCIGSRKTTSCGLGRWSNTYRLVASTPPSLELTANGYTRTFYKQR